MRLVAKGLNRNGFTVYGMQLAGHCGSEEDLLKTGWHDWYRSVCTAADRLRSDVDQCSSPGCRWAPCSHSSSPPTAPTKSMVLACTARRSSTTAGRFRGSASFRSCCRWCTGLGFGRHRKFHECFPYGIKDERIRQRIAGSMLNGDSAAGRPGRQSVAVARRVLSPVVSRAPAVAHHPARRAWSCTRRTTTSPA